MSTLGALMSTFGALMSNSGALSSPSSFGAETPTSPFTLGPFRLRSMSGMEMWGTVTCISGPFICPSGTTTFTLGAETSTSPFGSDASTSPFRPGTPNLGIFSLGIFSLPSGPQMSTSGASMSTLGALMSTFGALMSNSGALSSPSSFGAETPTSPFTLGPFRLRSMSGMEMWGTLTCISGPFKCPCGPAMSTLGA